jgi:hypothetical protein
MDPTLHAINGVEDRDHHLVATMPTRRHTSATRAFALVELLVEYCDAGGFFRNLVRMPMV